MASRREGRGVERVLGDGDEDSGFGAGEDDVEQCVDTGGGTGAEVDGRGTYLSMNLAMPSLIP